MLELDPEVWMRPKEEPYHVLQEQLKVFKKSFSPFDWTIQNLDNKKNEDSNNQQQQHQANE